MYLRGNFETLLHFLHISTTNNNTKKFCFSKKDPPLSKKINTTPC